MKTIHVVGKEEFTLGFLLAGIRNIFVDINHKKTAEHISSLLNRDANIVVIQQESFDSLPLGLQEDLVKSVRPVTVVLSKKGEAEKLREMIIKAIGVDLWQNDSQ